jgi:hypothetical protein
MSITVEDILYVCYYPEQKIRIYKDGFITCLYQRTSKEMIKENSWINKLEVTDIMPNKDFIEINVRI